MILWCKNDDFVYNDYVVLVTSLFVHGNDIFATKNQRYLVARIRCNRSLNFLSKILLLGTCGGDKDIIFDKCFHKVVFILNIFSSNYFPEYYVAKLIGIQK